jgi:serine/threonine-protein phosphatase 2A activator
VLPKRISGRGPRLVATRDAKIFRVSHLKLTSNWIPFTTRRSLSREMAAGQQVSSTSARMTMSLERLDEASTHTFTTPVKKIHDGPDVSFFLTSLAYRDIMTFVLQLNHSMIPRKADHCEGKKYQTWDIGSELVQFSSTVQKLRHLIAELESLITDAPPDTGPRRFGNVSFRKWYSLVESRITDLLNEHVPHQVLDFGSPSSTTSEPHSSTAGELKTYLLGSFGSPQRLDYGTGHELSFLAFLGCIWKLGGFPKTDQGVEERGIVLGVFQPYLNLIRQLIKIYTLEPAGSHGVWGLDDNSFLPYVFGSAQFCPAIGETEETPTESSIPDAPETSSVTKPTVVQQERTRNMYFSAVGFIYDVKRGPFWEHSPMLFDISGITAGWGKINKGMIKMYNAEVLSKFPVVQHFPFGSLFKWEKDPNAVEPLPRSDTMTQPLRTPNDMNQPVKARPTLNAGTTTVAPGPLHSGPGTPAPWATSMSKPPVGMVDGVTRAPWTSRTPPPPVPYTTANTRRGGIPTTDQVTGGSSLTTSSSASSTENTTKP